jgi:hypothetical protein
MAESWPVDFPGRHKPGNQQTILAGREMTAQ